MDEVSPTQIAAWKDQYGSVFSVDEFILRPVTLGEFERSFRDGSRAEQEESLVRAATLFPEEPDFDNCPAGLVTVLAEEVGNISGFGDPKRALKTLAGLREKAQGDVVTLAKAMVLASMPTYTEEQLDDLTFEMLMKKVVLAEEILKVHTAIAGASEVTLELLDPEEEAAKAEKAKQRHAASKRPGTATLDDPIAAKLHQAGV